MTAPIAFSSAWHIISILLVFLLGLAVARYTGVHIGKRGWRPIFLYVYHTFWCLVFFWYSNINGADSFAYYYAGLDGEGQLRFGTDFVILIVGILVKYFSLSYLGVFLVFNILGSVGYILFDGALRFASYGSKRWLRILTTLIILLPSVSFWSSAISKDAISFMAIGAALWAAIDFDKRIKLMFLAIFLMLLVRPHMAGLLVMSLSIAMFFDRSTSAFSRLLLSAVFVAGAAVLVPFALDYAGVKGGANIESVAEFIEKRQSYTRGAASIDIASMSFPEKLFTYAFRPVIIEARNLFEFAASIDNVILLFLFFNGVFLSFKVSLGGLYGNKVFMFFYAASSWSILSLTTANLGIALRQKWMFVPFIIYLSIAYLSRRQITRLSAN